MNKNIRQIKEAGITLIALVVTIIVLLILAGVTLSIAIDNGGLIGRARNAKETYKKAEENDTKALAAIDNFIADEMENKEIVVYTRDGKRYIKVNGQEYVCDEDRDGGETYYYIGPYNTDDGVVYHCYPSQNTGYDFDIYSSQGEFIESRLG